MLSLLAPSRPRFGYAIALVATACTRAPSPPPPARSAPPAASAAVAPSGPPRWALVHATVLDLRDGSALPDRAVVIEGGSIAAVVPAASLAGDAARERAIDVGGAFVMPGLWDMHAHPNDPYALRLFLANGVTGVRVMWGNPPPEIGAPAPPMHFEMRRAVAAGEREGPRLVIASSILDGPTSFWAGAVAVAGAAEGRQAVAEAAAAGVDFIKVYTSLPREAFFAIADESRARGLPFAGHVPDAVSAAEASEAGQRSVEHLSGVQLACSSREAELRRQRRPTPPLDGAAFARALRREATAARQSYDPAKARALFERFKAKGTWSCPTLSSLRPRDRSAPLAEEALAYVPAALRGWWRTPSGAASRAAQRAWDEYDREAWPAARALVGRMHEAGVPTLAGTDVGIPFLVPGFSLHEELALLVEAGLTPLEALQSATSGPARFLGREGELGAVEAGKLADLVVLDADPRVDVRRAARPRAVVAAGRLYDRAALDGLLEAARREARERPAPAGGRGGD